MISHVLCAAPPPHRRAPPELGHSRCKVDPPRPTSPTHIKPSPSFPHTPPPITLRAHTHTHADAAPQQTRLLKKKKNTPPPNENLRTRARPRRFASSELRRPRRGATRCGSGHSPAPRAATFLPDRLGALRGRGVSFRTYGSRRFFLVLHFGQISGTCSCPVADGGGGACGGLARSALLVDACVLDVGWDGETGGGLASVIAVLVAN